jgi:hypothetical protein
MNLMKAITASNLSLGWLAGLEYLLECGGTASQLSVGIENVREENMEIRDLLDQFSARKGIPPISTVANTIFPAALYYPDNPNLTGDKARYHLYQLYLRGNKVRRRCPANNKGTYFGRMIDYPVGKGKANPLERNQIERIITRLKSNLTRGNLNGSIYELSVGASEDYLSQDNTADILIRQVDKDTSIMGFPCLSHVSLNLYKGHLNMTALYRNQYFIQKAYGNYLGLSRLLMFICREVGCETGTLLCIANHADAELSTRGKQDIKKLVQDCNIESTYSQAVPVSG